jgi:hypothetical protein
MLERRDESRRTGPIATGHCEVPVVSIEDAIRLYKDRYDSQYDDYWYIVKRGVSITKEYN